MDIINMIGQDFIIKFNSLLISIIFAFIIAILGFAITYAKGKVDLIENKKVRESFKTSLDIVDTLLIKGIENAEKTLKPQILKSIEDGKVDKSELETLGEIVTKDVISKLKDDTKNVLQDNINNFEPFILDRMETLLEDLKDNPESFVQRTVIKTNNTKEDKEIIESEDIIVG